MATDETRDTPDVASGGDDENGATMDRLQVLPLVALRDTVIFPEMIVPLQVGRDRSVKALDRAVRTSQPVADGSGVSPGGATVEITSPSEGEVVPANQEIEIESRVDPGELPPEELAVTLALKLLVPVFGEIYDIRLPSGLPLREGAQSPLFVIDGVVGADLSAVAPDDIATLGSEVVDIVTRSPRPFMPAMP